MLELIVLGQIPGTNIYLSFTFVALVLIVSIAVTVAGVFYLKRHYADTKQKQADIEEKAV